MPFYIDKKLMQVRYRVRVAELDPERFLLVEDSLGKKHMQAGAKVSAEQLVAIQSGSVEAYLASPSPPAAVTNETQSGERGIAMFGFVAGVAWVVAGWSVLAQKMATDETIRKAFDISAIQIQQLDGAATTHAVVALVIAAGLSTPLFIAVSVRIVSLLKLSAAAGG